MKFSIVTPAYNMEHWISRTIETVLSQAGDFEIEYFIISDGSTDSTISIARSYSEKIASGEYPIACNKIVMHCIEQENSGMYETINRGFAKATGDMFAWINADDTYAPGAFQVIANAIKTFPDIQWIKGITATIDENDRILRPGRCLIYHDDWLKLGVYGQESYFVEQDSVFWSRKLWQKGGPMPAKYRSAGDYWLWLSFAKHSPLWSINFHISNFRKREGQISKGIARYKQEQLDARPYRHLAAWRPRLFFSIQSRLTRIFPYLEKVFIRIYPIFFPRRANKPYIELKNGKPIITTMRSYTPTT